MIILNMRKIFLGIGLLICFNWGYGQEDAKVKACFDGYKSAILDSNGKEAMKWVNTKTKNYYSDILDKVLNADSLAVEGLNIVDKVTVLRVRMALNIEEIKKMDGTSFFIYAIDKGMVGKNSVENVTMGDVTVTGAKAKGTFINKGQVAPFSFEFDKEKGNWKIDLTALFPMSNQGLAMMIESGGYDENDFIIRILGSLSDPGQKVGAHLWHPLK